jgi:hypothetical protein
MAHVLAVSLPRSGHHMLENVLRAVLGNRYAFCEFYNPKDCCKAIPCKKAANLEVARNGLFLQKSHDFHMEDPVFVDGTIRLIQYRAPVKRVLSNYDLFLHRTKLPRGKASLLRSLGEDAPYAIKFYRKWLELPKSEALYLLPYETMLADPVGSTRDLLHFCRVNFDAETIESRIRTALEYRVYTKDKFVVRTIDEEFNDLLADYEEMIFKYCPKLDSPRYFSNKSDGSLTPFEALALAVDSMHGPVATDPVLPHDWDNSLKWAQIAQTAYPDNEFVSWVSGQISNKARARTNG